MYDDYTNYIAGVNDYSVLYIWGSSKSAATAYTWDLKKVVGILRPILEINQDAIKKTIKVIPEIFENARHISRSARETTDDLRISAPLILKEVEVASNSAKETIENAGVIIEKLNFGSNKVSFKDDGNGFMSYLYIFEEVLQIVIRTFNSSK